MNSNSVNLNLLLALEALLDERNVSRAAKRVGLSQPAMSHALRRLRELFEDPLLTRDGRVMAPTPRALEIVDSLRGGLSQLRSVLDVGSAFDTATSNRSFRVAMTDYVELMVMGPMLPRIHNHAPGVQILIRRVDQIFTPPEEDLRSGRFDVAIGFYPEASGLQPRTHSQDLFTEENVCIARKGHALFRKELSLRGFAAAKHLAIFYHVESRGLIDSALANHGLRRNLTVTTPTFLTAPHLVAASDLIAVVPAGLAEAYRKLLPLEVRALPFQLPPFRMRMLWNEHAALDPSQRWLRSELGQCTSPQKPVHGLSSMLEK